ncbi:MAG: hypothetical protein OWV35_08245, partial [Firmicutes bacterium]|nr:hypothetical protein [Bacillota bacterium]
MGFWQRRREGGGWDADASRRRMEAGELPLAAGGRLAARPGGWGAGPGKGAIGALARVGFLPAAPVTGTAVLAFEIAPPEPDPQWAEPTLGPQAELAAVSRAQERVRTLALERLGEEA